MSPRSGRPSVGKPPRIVAGRWAGRPLHTLGGGDTRPTSARVREAVFNALESAGWLHGARVVDLFAGSGALGLEALSRGAGEVVLVERSALAVGVISRNLAELGGGGNARVERSEALRWLRSAAPCDLILCDPPYRFADWDDLLGAVPCDRVVAETDRDLPAPPGWEVTRSRRYGRTWVVFLERSSSERAHPSEGRRPDEPAPLRSPE